MLGDRFTYFFLNRRSNQAQFTYQANLGKPIVPIVFFQETSIHLLIQLFRERLSEKMCTRQPRKVIWDMINTLFLTTVAVEPTLVAFH